METQIAKQVHVPLRWKVVVTRQTTGRHCSYRVNENRKLIIIVKRLWACYMEKALYKCTTLLYCWMEIMCFPDSSWLSRNIYAFPKISGFSLAFKKYRSSRHFLTSLPKKDYRSSSRQLLIVSCFQEISFSRKFLASTVSYPRLSKNSMRGTQRNFLTSPIKVHEISKILVQGVLP